MARTRDLAACLAAALRHHLAGGKPVVPEAGILFWSLFMEISASCTYHAAGPHPISFAEIEAYARLARWPLQPRHIAIIRALDDAWLEHAYRSMGGEKAKAPAHASGELTPAMFDAVWG